MKRSSRFALIAGIVFAFTSSARAEKPFRDLSFDAACKAAKKEKKVVMIDFYTTWCGPCKLLDRTTWKDAKVQAWLKDKTVPIKVDAEKQRKLSKRYQIRAYPTILFLKPDGKKIDRLIGYRKADAFLEEAKSSLAGKTSLMRAKEALKGHEKDPMERMKYADALAREGRNEEALKEYLWCFDHGNEHSIIFSGVRVSTLVSKIARMTKPYAPAMTALEQRRDAAKKIVLSAPPQATFESRGLFGWLTGARDNRMDFFYAAQVLSGINRSLGQNKETLKVYDQLVKKGKGYDYLRPAMFHTVLDLLWEARRYDDIVDGVGDIQKWIDGQESSFRRTKVMLSKYPHAAEYSKRYTIKQGGKRYEAFLGAGKRKVAQAAAERLIKFSPSSETYVTLIEHAVRAGDKAAAQALAKGGLKALPEKDRAAVRMAIANADEEATNAP